MLATTTRGSTSLLAMRRYASDYRTEYFVFYNGQRPCMLATNLSPFNRENE
jgi:hypothetical protein